MTVKRFFLAGVLFATACGPATSAGDGDGGLSPDATGGDPRAAQCGRIVERARACSPASTCQINASMGLCMVYRPEFVAALEACSTRGCDAGSCQPPTNAPSAAFTAAVRAICTACPAIVGGPGATADACAASPMTAELFRGIIGGFDDATLTQLSACFTRLPSEPVACVAGVETCLGQTVPAYTALRACMPGP